MKKKSVRAMLTIALLMSIMAPFASAEEKIIQQEDISFEKCVNVITISEDKLSIAPEITDESDQKRIAIFTLIDGTLKITCDGVKGNITVSTNMN
jgi:hypothetical protein